VGGRFANHQRYKVRAFRKKKATKIGLFIDRLLTIIFNLCCRCVEGILARKNCDEKEKNFHFLFGAYCHFAFLHYL